MTKSELPVPGAQSFVVAWVWVTGRRETFRKPAQLRGIRILAMCNRLSIGRVHSLVAQKLE